METGSSSVEIIEEKSPLDPVLDPNLDLFSDGKKTGQTFSLSGGTESEEAAKAKAYIHSLAEGLFGRMSR